MNYTKQCVGGILYSIPELQKYIYGTLIFGSILAAFKMLLWGYSYDEEYQIVMSYRNLMGDTMLMTMYEPHQTSSFLCTFLMWIYRSAAGSYDGVVIWLRICGTVFHLLLSIIVYQFCKKDLHLENGLLIAIVYFNIIPKLFMIPDFSNMQMWFFTLTVILVTKYCLDGHRIGCLIGGGVTFALLVLAYPSMVILLPLLCAVVFWKSAVRDGVCRCLILLGTCIVCALLYVGYFLIRDGGFAVFETGVRLFHWDGSHAGVLMDCKWKNLLLDVGIYAVWLIGIYAVAIVGAKLVLKKQKRELLLCTANIAVLISCTIQLFIWIVFNPGNEYLQIYIAVTLAAGIIYYAVGEKRTEHSLLLMLGIVGSILMLVGVCLMTNLGLLASWVHASVGIVFVLMIWGNRRDQLFQKVLIMLCFTLIFGKGYTMRGSAVFNNVLESNARLLYGPAAGCITDFNTAQIYNRVYETWESMEVQGKNLLVVSNSVRSPMNIWYMFDESQVSHYSVVNPSFYDEHLLEYWKLYPEKTPDVIAVESSEGRIVIDENTWIMKYIYEEFDYTDVRESYFVTFYNR